MKNLVRPAISLFIILTLITGVLYPLAITAIGKIFFPHQANGSLIKKNNAIVGSSLIGQQFTHPSYFWGRPSATQPFPYDGLHSGGSNFAHSNPAQQQAMAKRVKELQEADPANTQKIPVDLITASGSGLDPHISPAAAHYQVQRVANARHLRMEEVSQLVRQYTEPPQLGLFGEARVNVLRLNLALDTYGK